MAQVKKPAKSLGELINARFKVLKEIREESPYLGKLFSFVSCTLGSFCRFLIGQVILGFRWLVDKALFWVLRNNRKVYPLGIYSPIQTLQRLWRKPQVIKFNMKPASINCTPLFCQESSYLRNCLKAESYVLVTLWGVCR